MGSYPQPLRSPVLEGRRFGAMDNFLYSIFAEFPKRELLCHDFDPDGCLVQQRKLNTFIKKFRQG